MTKEDEYIKAREEFSLFFYNEIKKILAAAPPSEELRKEQYLSFKVTQQNRRIKIYQDFKALYQHLLTLIGNNKPSGENFLLCSTNNFDKAIEEGSDLFVQFINGVGTGWVYRYGFRVDFYPNGRPKNKIEISSYCGSYAFRVNISNQFSNVIYSYIDALVSTSTQINQLSKLQKEAENEQIKLKRVRTLQDNSIEEWITNVLKDSNYPYQIEKAFDNKLFLLVKMNGTQHLKIPVYRKSFQKIVPLILEAIQQYENVVKNSKIRVLVDNNAPNQQWKM